MLKSIETLKLSSTLSLSSHPAHLRATPEIQPARPVRSLIARAIHPAYMGQHLKGSHLTGFKAPKSKKYRHVDILKSDGL